MPSIPYDNVVQFPIRSPPGTITPPGDLKEAGVSKEKRATRIASEMTPSMKKIQAAALKVSAKATFNFHEAYLDFNLEPVARGSQGRRFYVYTLRTSALSATKSADLYRAILRAANRVHIVSTEQIKQMREKARLSREQIDQTYNQFIRETKSWPSEVKVAVCLPSGLAIGTYLRRGRGVSPNEIILKPGIFLTKHPIPGQWRLPPKNMSRGEQVNWIGIRVGAAGARGAKIQGQEGDYRVYKAQTGDRNLFNSGKAKTYLCEGQPHVYFMQRYGELIAHWEREKALAAMTDKAEIQEQERLLMKSARVKGLIKLAARNGQVQVVVYVPESRKREELAEEAGVESGVLAEQTAQEEAIADAIIESNTFDPTQTDLDDDAAVEEDVAGDNTMVMVAGAGAVVALLFWWLRE